MYSAVIYGLKPYAGLYFGSFERKSASARWPPTRRQSCKLDLWVCLWWPNIHPSLWLLLTFKRFVVVCV